MKPDAAASGGGQHAVEEARLAVGRVDDLPADDVRAVGAELGDAAVHRTHPSVDQYVQGRAVDNR